MKRLLLFGAGKSATSLIRYLTQLVASRDWRLVVADSNLVLAQSKIGTTTHAIAIAVEVGDDQERERLIGEADVVVSLLPPALHYLVAQSCLKYRKHLLTASYLDPAIKALEPAIRDNQVLFLCEMGLDPGIDHMSSVELITEIKKKGGRIISFRSHTGGLVAPESDDNPWHYKISWNPRNVVMAGSTGARYRENGKVTQVAYNDLFSTPRTVQVNGIGELAWYPNRDSLGYIPLYGVEDVDTFIRTTLRYSDFCIAWESIVRAGLTNDNKPIGTEIRSFADWSSPILPFLTDANCLALTYLGLFDAATLPDHLKTSADILQFLLETKLAMRTQDKDMIVMQHEIAYQMENDPKAVHETKSTLIVTGEDSLQTAMAKTVGLPLGIAAKLILEEKLSIRGLYIPIVPEVYIPVLAELEELGVRFQKSSLLRSQAY